MSTPYEQWRREQRIAHLEIHGWRPMREVPSAESGYGIHNFDLNVGFRVTGLGSPNQKVRKTDANRLFPCEWDEVSDKVLFAIDERLAAV